jgi:hypothetical protein
MEDTLDLVTWFIGVGGLINFLSENPMYQQPCDAHIYTWVQVHRTSICCTIAFYDAVRYSKMPTSFRLARLDGLALQPTLA